MSNYTKSTNFATKDTLPTGNAGKIIKGTEIDTEFNNIATAVATKLDSSALDAELDAITGKVVQMVQTTGSVAYSTSGSYQATGHTAQITPTSATSKILVILSSSLWQTNGYGGNSFLAIYRNGSNIIGSNDWVVFSAPGQNLYGSVAFQYLDSPASTSALTYQPYIHADSGGTTAYNGTGTAVLTLLEITV